MSETATAQISPPNNARLLGVEPTVTFRWPGTARTKYFVQVYASTAEVYSGEVTGNVLELSLKPGPRYRWQVSKVVGGGYSEVVATQNFQLSSELRFAFDGKSGKAGKQASRRTEYGRFGENGGDGSDGANGADLNILLSWEGDFVKLALTGPNTTQTFFLLPDCPPLQLSVRGGDGGDGGSGGPGGAGFFSASWHRYGSYIDSFAPGVGGDGGEGGAGGRGGDVRVSADGVEPRDFLQIDNRGGAGGRGGPPGPGGAAAIIPLPSRGGVPQQYIVPAPPGRPGLAGEDGAEGQIFSR